MPGRLLFRTRISKSQLRLTGAIAPDMAVETIRRARLDLGNLE